MWCTNLNFERCAIKCNYRSSSHIRYPPYDKDKKKKEGEKEKEKEKEKREARREKTEERRVSIH